MSPQYHCVFGESIQTVFRTAENDEVVKVITLLWGNSCEVCADENFDEDGMLVYQPPPLHKAWLDKEERNESKNRFCWKCDQKIDKEKDVKRKIVD